MFGHRGQFLVPPLLSFSPTVRRSSPFFGAALSGALLAFSFPPHGHPATAWVALTPLLIALFGARSSTVGFALGVTTGVVHFAGLLPWLTTVMMEFGGLPLPAGVALNGLLVAYLALFPGAFGAIFVLLCRRYGESALWIAGPVWLSTELGRLWLLGGFPWELLGYSQTAVLPIAQLASLFGVHGVTVLVVFVNGVLTLLAVGQTGRRGMALTVGVAVLVAVVLFGTWRLSDEQLLRAGTPLRVGLVQGNVPQEDKWDPAHRVSIVQRYLELSRRSAAAGAELVVWPESATPFSFETHSDGGLVRGLTRETGIHLLFGSTRFESYPTRRMFNAAFVLNPDGETAAIYDKIHLVPFGEYVPFRSLLFFAAPLVDTVADLTPGVDPVTLPVGSHLVSAAICYEIIYPSLVRESVREGSQLLTTITNDAWYGRSGAPHQHFQQARMRAIEQGRYLVRAANTGISGVVDPYGRVVARSALFETTTINQEVRLLAELTVYGKIGDILAYASALATLGLVFLAWRAKR
ncbi:MAG TPA: apolipoprotein N-acyltransferase [Acidobacteria bacterium]|nr:apolipoprotein N-acyltransferase [Acidobacteriota bacterium]